MGCRTDRLCSLGLVGRLLNILAKEVQARTL